MTAPASTDGPAFPLPGGLYNGTPANLVDGSTGMTLREYFAAHAPEMPPWFKCYPTRPMPQVPDKYLELTSEEREEFRGLGDWLQDSEVSTKVLDFRARLDAAQGDLCRWQEEQKVNAFIAWRWRYADMMMSTRDGS